MKSQKKINEGLAEVCEMLAKYKKITSKQKKDFLRYANIFRGLAKLNKKNIEPKQHLIESKSKGEVINMVKKLTDTEKEVREVKKILLKIRKLEKQYPQHLVERACFRYKSANLDKRKAEKEMKELEEKLEDAKKRLR